MYNNSHSPRQNSKYPHNYDTSHYQDLYLVEGMLT